MADRKSLITSLPYVRPERHWTPDRDGTLKLAVGRRPPLKKDATAELDESLLGQLHGTVSLPFEAGWTCKPEIVRPWRART